LKERILQIVKQEKINQGPNRRVQDFLFNDLILDGFYDIQLCRIFRHYGPSALVGGETEATRSEAAAATLVGLDHQRKRRMT
jgi:hypothetical protein